MCFLLAQATDMFGALFGREAGTPMPTQAAPERAPASRRLESGDSLSAYAYDSNHADGTKGGQVVLVCDAYTLASRLPVFQSASHISVVEYMGVLFSHILPPRTAELGLDVDEEVLRVDRAYLNRFGTAETPKPSNVVLRFAQDNEQLSRVDLDELLPLDYVYQLSTTAQAALAKNALLRKHVWLTLNGTHLRHVSNSKDV